MPKWCDEGENMVADIIFGTLALKDPLYIGLYENGTEPAEDDQLTDLTEQSGEGYVVRGSLLMIPHSTRR